MPFVDVILDVELGFRCQCFAAFFVMLSVSTTYLEPQVYLLASCFSSRLMYEVAVVTVGCEGT